ncbi:hypothetical protein Avbf_12647 [Armadillidium vulgare]|nr:hypothetical protein Avbf_12647 [Armadillidium vulgare]
MYSMNLTKFDAGHLLTTFSKAELENKELRGKISNSIMQHHFNSKVMIHVPNTSTLPNSISQCVKRR